MKTLLLLLNMINLGMLIQVNDASNSKRLLMGNNYFDADSNTASLYKEYKYFIR